MARPAFYEPDLARHSGTIAIRLAGSVAAVSGCERSADVFDYRDFYRQPAWMDAPRGPDVSPDMAVATTTPMGYGQLFAPEHCVDAWLALTGPQGWSADRLARLKQHLANRGRM